jgi:multisubunit Na+/H+ antiporter MnhE subunit
MVLRRTEYQYPFIRIQLGLLVISLIVTLAFWLFKLENKYSVLNTILGYIVLIPAIFLLRTVYGNYLFRFTWMIYIIVVVVGIIYGVAVYVVSKKYKKEVDELNELLHKDKE